jgi:acetyl-CoA carboxylase, biotin carboxylase subunit
LAAKVLIANRGEIVLRIARTCSRLGYVPCGIYSEADRGSLHIKQCKEAVNIGGYRPSESYLCADKIIKAAAKLGCEMVHPGYGFLAENREFASLCETSGITFIGPSSSTLELTGDKARARQVASDVAPVVEGGEVANETEAVRLAETIGFPIILKAVKGGGGRGLRVVNSTVELKQAFSSSQSESMLSFGSGRLYLEKYLENPRHIEVQILGDSKTDTTIQLGERECSVQRRHQKLIEETPSAALDSMMRKRLTESAIEIAKKVKYDNAGTIEFLYKDGKFYFMEVNSRIQVEHPITEMVTGVDIVEQQFQIAAGQGLGIKQSDVTFRGHAIECRINAEHPITFAPYPGQVAKFIPPAGSGIRVDSALYPGYTVPPFYDSLLAKVVCHAESRSAAIEKMKRALTSTKIGGIPTTISFHLSALHDHRFISGNYDTSFATDLKHYSSKAGEAAAAVFTILPKRRRSSIINTGEGKDSDPWLKSRSETILSRANDLEARRH